jgi:NAD(P)-dependent dehydrogenase (short-subunit alcohol dehydrogenase family)
MNIENKTVLITGANRGIGKAYAEEFLKSGAKKIYLGVRDLKSVEEFVAQAPDKLTPIKLDVTNADEIEAAAKTADDVEILINNAGILFLDSSQDTDTAENARKEFEVNFIGPLLMTQAFAPILKKNGGGVLITVSSIAGHVTVPGFASYCASKYAAQSLILSHRLELKQQGTHVIGVYPGPIETDMTKDIDFDTFPPSIVTQATIEAIKNGEEDVFPDPMSQEFYAAFRENPKTSEANMLAMMQEAQEAA